MGRGGSNPPSDTPPTCRNTKSPGSDLRPPGLSLPQYFPVSYSSCIPKSRCSLYYLAQPLTSSR
jgi:hypothetical protein